MAAFAGAISPTFGVFYQKIAPSSTEYMNPTMLSSIIIGAVNGCVSGGAITFLITVAINIYTSWKRKVTVIGLSEFIGSEIYAREIWTEFINNDLIELYKDQKEEGRFKNVKIIEFGDIPLAYKNAATEYFKKFEVMKCCCCKSSYCYNVLKNTIISSTVGLIVGALVGYAKFSFE